MLSIIIGPGRFGPSTHVSWTDGEPVPKELDLLLSDSVVQFTANGRELELILHAMNGDTEHLKESAAPTPLPGAAVEGTVSLAWVVIGMLAAAHYSTDGDDKATMLEQACALADRCARAVMP